MDDDDCGEVVVVEGDFFSGREDDFHDAGAVVFKDGVVACWGRLEVMVATGI